jgi:triosephosphate isomerase
MTKLFVANWKMYKTLEEVRDFFKEFLPKVKDVSNEIVICPPSVYLQEANKLVQGSNVKIGAQNIHSELQGAFTGEISLPMVEEFCDYVLLGHSERRMQETNDIIHKKLLLVLGKKMKAILCVGERLEHRQLGDTNKILEEQLSSALHGVPSDKVANLVVAYEPVWAIGTGINATPEQAEEAHKFIRSMLSNTYGARGKNVRILYGGSVTPEDIGSLIRDQDVDGVLVGGASLNARAFAAIVKV